MLIQDIYHALFKAFGELILVMRITESIHELLASSNLAVQDKLRHAFNIVYLISKQMRAQERIEEVLTSTASL